MRLLRVHAPGADPRLTESVREAIRAFNASLDIRLRFLSIGIEDRVLDVSDAADAEERVSAEAARDLRGGPADLLLLSGGGAAAAAAAEASLRCGLPVIRVGAGDPAAAGAAADDTRAADRACPVLLAFRSRDAAELREAAVSGAIEVVGEPDDAATGEKIVRAVCRARRRERC